VHAWVVPQLPFLSSVEGYGQRHAPSLNVLPPVHPGVPPHWPVWYSRALQHVPSDLYAGQPVFTWPQLGPWQPGSTKKHWPLRPILVPSGQVTVIVGGGGGGGGIGGVPVVVVHVVCMHVLGPQYRLPSSLSGQSHSPGRQ
jgi:hypothetical protein